MQRRHLIACAALATLAPSLWAADAWPSRPINYIVPFPPGGNTDILGRLLAQKLAPVLKTNIIVDNKPGAGGTIGSDYVARQAPDGYTVIGGTISTHAINVSLYPKLGYDPVKSFVPVAMIGFAPLVLVVSSNSPYKTVAEFLAAARAKSGAITGASAGSGTSQHMALELLGYKLGSRFVHVPYKGSGPAIQDVMTGQVDAMFETTLVSGPFIQSGKLRVLAVSTAKRLDSFPQVPTMIEAGVAGFEVASWQALFAPAGTPAAVVARLHDETLSVLHQPDVQKRLITLGLNSSDMTPEQLGEFQKAEVVKWAQVIKAAGIKLD